MTKGSFIPMSPEELPQQRVYEVVDLPPTPVGLETKLDWVEPFPDNRPKTTPRKVQFLCAVEWAWSPMHNRIDNYYLHQRGKRWLIWNNWLDDNDVPWRWHWDVLAYADKVDADPEAIAIHMLRQTWEQEAKHATIDHYHWINDTGLLSVDQVQAIARTVWG